MTRTDRNDVPTLEELTDRQIEVLDLLVRHNSTKEIAKVLDLAPVTVDEHIAAVRQKWGSTRNETARIYGALVGIYDKPMPGNSRVDGATDPVDQLAPGLPRTPVFQLRDVVFDYDYLEREPVRTGPEALDARFGKGWRIVAILVLAVLLGMIGIWGLAFAAELGQLI